MEWSLKNLESAIDAEYDAKNKDVSEILVLPSEEKIRKGQILIDLEAEFFPLHPSLKNDEGYFCRVKIKCKDNNSKFREGSPVCLEWSNYRYEMTVLEDLGNTMLLEETFHVYQKPPNLKGDEKWTLQPAKVDIRNVLKKCSFYLRDNLEKKERIFGILKGKMKPKYNVKLLSHSKSISKNLKLNLYQKNAFENAYSSENFHVIQGPPGSGKTWLAGYLASQFMKEGKKVLITSSTHTAINNALNKIAQINGSIGIFKIGKAYQTDNLNYNNTKIESTSNLFKIWNEFDQKGIIVGATCYAPFTRKLEKYEWDVIIFDEAAQLSISLGIAGMAKGKKYIFIGDHKQLPPIVSDNIKHELFRKSLFETVYNNDPGNMLEITYRMNEEINKFSSTKFYDGRLKPHENNKRSRLNIPNNFSRYKEVLDIDKPEILYLHFHDGDGSRSLFEANLSTELAQEYIKLGINPDEIAIISPFRAQVRAIKNEILEKVGENELLKNIFIDTIERIQGQERDIIIYSIAASDMKIIQDRPDFFYSPNRLNVALTRARKKRIVIANKSIFEYHSKDPEVDKLVSNFRDFYQVSTVIEELPPEEVKDLF